MRRAVVDQSGLKVVLIGIFVSLFLGLIFKSQIRPAVVKSRFEKVLIRLQKDMNIDFEEVDVQLSEWGIPRPVVEIRGLRLSPLKKTCQDNQIYIESLSFPLSYNLLFEDKKVINSLRISLMEVRVRHLEACLKNDNESLKTASSLNALNHLNEKPVLEQVVSSSSTHLKDINIDRLRIIDTDQLRSSIDFNAMQIAVSYKNQKVEKVNLQSQLLMFKDSLRNLYLFKSEAKIKLTLSDNGFVEVDSDISGLILDRPIKLKIKTDVAKSTLNLFGEFNAISLKSLNFILKNEDPTIEVYEFLSGSTLSGFVTGEYSFKDKSSEVIFSKMKIVFGGGSAELNDLHLNKNTDKKWIVKPFDIQLNHVDLTKILDQPYFEKIKPSIQNAGFISGMIQYDQSHKIKINSLLEKVSFYFSNRSIRVNQVFESFNMRLVYDFEKLDLVFNDFILNGQKILGFIKYQNSKDNHHQLLTADLKGSLFTKDTMKLFTGDSYETPLQLTFSTDFQNRISGKALIQLFRIQNFEAHDLIFDYKKDLTTSDEDMNFKSAKVIIDRDSQNQDSSEKYPINQLFDLNIFEQRKLLVHSFSGHVDKSKYDFTRFDFNAIASADISEFKKTPFSEIKYTGTLDSKLNMDSQLIVKNKKSVIYKLNGLYDQLNISK